MDEKKSFGEYIRKKRLESAQTQKQLADALFVAESTVSKWERGLSYPDVSLIPAVCRALHISEHEFFTACDDEQARQEQRAAAVGRGVIQGWRRFFAASYGAAIVICFLCDLALFHTLDWFWIVLTAIGLAFCVTNLPFRVQRNRLPVCLGAGTACLILLLLACWTFVGGRWLGGAVAITAAALSLPWGIYALWRFYGRHMAVLSMVLFSLWTFFLLAVIWGMTGGAWLLSLAWPLAALSLAFLWGAFGALMWLPGSRWLKAGTISLLFSFAIPAVNSLCTHLIPAQDGPSFLDYFAWGRILSHLSAGDFSWANILIFVLMLAASLVLLAVGAVRTHRGRHV